MGLFDFLKGAFGDPVERRDAAKPAPAPAPKPSAAPAAQSELARTLNSTDAELRWLCDPWRLAARENAHYVAFTIPKRTSGVRTILAPKKKLKRVQREILSKILSRHAPLEPAHGFVKGRSILTNARPHVGAAVLVKADLENFFHTIGFARVRGLFRKRFNLPEETARTLAYLSTAAVGETIQGTPGNLAETYFSGTPESHRVAVQGAPTSPAIANFVCRRLDARLAGLAKKFNAAYTRYADDLTFSGGENFRRVLPNFIPLLREIIAGEGFRLSKRKFVIVRPGSRQIVTGLVVNKTLGVDRRYVRRLKAILHNCAKTGPAKQARGLPLPKFRARLEGQIAFVRSVDPKKAERLATAFRRVAWA